MQIQNQEEYPFLQVPFQDVFNEIIPVPQQIVRNVGQVGHVPEEVIAQIKKKNKLKRTQQRKRLNALKQRRRQKAQLKQHRKIMQMMSKIFQDQKKKEIQQVQNMVKSQTVHLHPKDKQVIHDEKQVLLQLIQTASQQKKHILLRYLEKVDNLEKQNATLVQRLEKRGQKNKLPGFFQYFSLKKDEMKQQYQQDLARIRKQTQQKIRETQESIKGFIMNIKQAIHRKVNAGVDQIKNAYRGASNSLSELNNAINQKVHMTSQGLKQFTHNIGEGVKNIGRGISDGFTSTTQGIKQFGQGIGQGAKTIGRGIGNKAHAVKQGIRQFGHNIGQGFNNLGQGIERKYRQTKQGLQQFGHNLGQGAKKIGKGIGTGALYLGAGTMMAGQGIGKGVSYVGKGIGKGVKYLGHQIGQGYNYVKNKFRKKQGQEEEQNKQGFFVNLWNGIKNKASWIAGLAKKAGSYLKNGAAYIVDIINRVMAKLNLGRLIKTFGVTRLPQYLQKYVFTDYFWQIVGMPFPPFIGNIIRDIVQNFFLGSTNSVTGRIPSFTDHLLVNGIDGVEDWKQYGVLSLGQTLGKYGDSLTGGYISNFLFPQKQAPIFDQKKQSFTKRITGGSQYDYGSYAFGGQTTSKQQIQKMISQKKKKSANQWDFQELIPGQLNQKRWKVRSYGPSGANIVQQGSFLDQMKHSIQKNHFGADVLRVLEKKIQEKQIQFNNRRRQMLKTGQLTQKNYQQQLQKDMKTMQKYITSLQLTHKLIMIQIEEIKKFIIDPNTKYMNGMFYIQKNGVIQKSMKVPQQMIPYLSNWKVGVDFERYVVNRLVNEDIKRVNQIQKKINQTNIQAQYQQLPLWQRTKNQAKGFAGAIKTVASTGTSAAFDLLQRHVVPKVISQGLSDVFEDKRPVQKPNYPKPDFTQQAKTKATKQSKKERKKFFQPTSSRKTAKQFLLQGKKQEKGFFDKALQWGSLFFY